MRFNNRDDLLHFGSLDIFGGLCITQPNIYHDGANVIYVIVRIVSI